MPGTRWLTFDCYGTIADWNACMLGALEPIAGARAAALLAAYHRAESILEAMPSWRPYREVLTEGLALAGRRTGVAVPEGQAGAFVAAWPSIPLFDDVAEALSTLVSFGWRMGILTNCDDDLFALTAASLPVPFEVVVTAEQVRSYKPDLGHFRRFAELTGATPDNWIHVANSWVHDVLPAARMGLRSVWVDRDHTGHPAKFAERRVTSMRRLPETVTDVSVLPAWPLPLTLLCRRADDNGVHGYYRGLAHRRIRADQGKRRRRARRADTRAARLPARRRGQPGQLADLAPHPGTGRSRGGRVRRDSGVVC